MMKPHIWLRPPAWPGSIDHNTDREWAEWFTSYRDFILHYARLSARVKRPVLFTELGYRSSDYAAARPWEHHGGATNLELQADAFRAFFRVVWPQPWFGGVYIWKWESYPNHARADDGGFTIEHKPAEDVVRRYFAGSSARR